MQSSIVSVDSLAWGAFERTFPSNVREQLADVPQQMILALGPELANAWLVAEEAIASVRAEVEAAAVAAPSQAAAPAPDDQLEITMRDGSVLRGTLDAAKLPFVSGYGTIEVATSAITSFDDGRLALEDGSVLKGDFGAGEVSLTTSHGVMRLPAGDIIAINRGAATAAREPPSAGGSPEPALARGQGTLMGRVLDPFGQPVGDVTVRIAGSNLRTATNSAGEYRLPYVPGKFRLVIEKAGYDSEQFELDLAQSATFPVADKSLVSVPPNPGLFFWGRSDWVPISVCRSEQVEKDTNSFLTIRFIHPVMMTRYGCGAVRAQA